MDEADHIRDTQTVMDVQSELRALGYSQVGATDGAVGRQTQAAILDFQNRNGYPLYPFINSTLVEQLKVAPKIVLPETQLNATAAIISPKIVAIRATWWSKVSAWILGIPSALLVLVSSIVDKLPDATDKIAPLKAFLSDVPTWVWAGGVFAVAFVIILKSHKTENALVQGYRAGTVKEDRPAGYHV